MIEILNRYGFVKTSLYEYINDVFTITLYYDTLTITKIDDDDIITLYEGLKPNLDELELLIEQKTKLKKVNNSIEDILNETKSKRIYTNTSLYISGLLINYMKYVNNDENIICDKLNITLDKLKEYISGSYDFKLSELSDIAVLTKNEIKIK